MTTIRSASSVGTSSVRNRRGRKASLRSAARSVIESLESRTLLEAVSWDGGGDASSWNDPFNWSSDAVPTAADDVTIDDTGTSAINIIDPQEVNSVTSAEVLNLSGGTFTINAASTFNNTFNFVGGTLQGAGNLTFNSSFSWSAGTMAGLGESIIASAATLAISGTGAKNLQRVLTSNGAATMTAGNVTLTDGTFNNNGTFNADISTTARTITGGAAGSVNAFNNAGIFNKTGNNTLTFTSASGGVAFNNSGTVNVGGTGASAVLWQQGGTSSGDINLTSGNLNITNSIAVPYNITGGTITVNSGRTLTVSGGQPLALQGATLRGNGVVAGSITNTGTVSPGVIPGTLQINTNYEQTSGGTLAVEINGPTPGSDFDVFRVIGAVALDGSISAALNFAAQRGDTFAVLENDGVDAITGTFAGLPEGEIFPGTGAHFQISYLGGVGGNDVALTAVPEITIDDVSINEIDGVGAETVFTVTVSLNGATTVNVDFATALGTAQAADFTAVNGTLTFGSGVTTQTITVPITGDLIDEFDQTFLVNLSNAANGVITDGQGVGTIADNDPPPTVSVDDVTVNEAPGGSNAVFTVTLSSISEKPISMEFSTAVATATAGVDYTTTSGTLNFAPGETSHTIVVPILDDTTDEPDQTFVVNLTNLSNVDSGDVQGLGTIVDDEPPPTVSIADVTVTELDGGTVNAVFTVTLSEFSQKPISVSFATSGGDATAGADYLAQTGTVNFTEGQTSQTITIIVNDELTDEDAQTFEVTLSSPENVTIADGVATGTIQDNDPPPTISINDVTVIEGDGAAVPATFTVSLSLASEKTITVDFATALGSAEAADFTANNGTLTFAAGVTSQTVTVQVTGDLTDEIDQTFLVNLSNPANVTIADGTGVGTIQDNDPPPTVSINDVTVAEGADATFTITLSLASEKTITMDFATAPGSATSDDFTAQAGSLTFAPGVTSQTIIIIATLPDALDEIHETFTVVLSNLSEAAPGDLSGTGTITDDDPPPTASINDVSVTEGNASSTDAIFTVTLSAPSGQTITIGYSTGGGTATPGSDYTATTGALTFAPGVTTQTIAVPVLGDVTDEDDQTYLVTLATPHAVVLADDVGQGTILDDDDAPTVSIADAVGTEGANAEFAVTLSAASEKQITVNFATADGTAVSPGDYALGAGTLTFAPGVTSQSITVALSDDALDEEDEAFTVNLSGLVNAGAGDLSATGTILDNDAPVSISINDVTLTEGTGGPGTPVTFTVTLSAASGRTVIVDFATAADSATSGDDFAAAAGTLTFTPGVISQTITVLVAPDSLTEATESFFVNLTSPQNGTLADGQGVGTITDDDAVVPSLSINDVTVTEGDSGAVNALLTVSLSQASTDTITVDFSTADGTAAAPGDYSTTSGTLTFAPGVTSMTISVPVAGDTLDEIDETFSVNLTNAANATIADGQGIGTIIDDDPEVSISINDVTVTEGHTGTVDAVFTVSLSSASGKTVTVNFASAAGSATEGTDYQAASGSLTFAPGVTTQTITVLVNGDVIDEEDQTFLVNLTNAANPTIADGQGLGTIQDDDDAPTISIADASAAEAAGTMAFVVTLSGPSERTITVDFVTADGTAIAPGDYTTTGGTLTFAPGATSQTISVPIVSDNLDESDEAFFVDLSNPTNGNLANNQGLGTILDDDTAALSINDVSVTEGDAGTVNAVFTVTLSNPSTQTITVDFSTADGSALASLDYTTTPGTLTFLPGQTSMILSIPVAGDVLDEFDETFAVDLANAVNAGIADGQGIGTIVDDDPEVSISINDVSAVEGNAGTVEAVFTVTLSSASGKPVTVNFAPAQEPPLKERITRRPVGCSPLRRASSRRTSPCWSTATSSMRRTRRSSSI